MLQFHNYLICLFGIILIYCHSLTIHAAPPIFVKAPDEAFALSEDLKLDVFLVFTAQWCASCQVMKNDIHSNLDDFQNTIICYVDYDLYKNMAVQYGVKILPDYRIYRNKIEIRQKIGYNNKTELIDWFNQETKKN